MGVSNGKTKKQFLLNINQSDIDLIDRDIIEQKKPIKVSNVNLLDSIKSFYMTKNIFSYLKKIKKFQILIYNKKYQNKFELNLEDYKKAKGMYMEKTSNGIIKYYSLYSKKLQFEGIYLRGKRIKYGREYWYDGLLKFEGYYLYGEKSGKGKEYLNKRLIYSGEFRNNKRNGKGKEYDNEKIIFEGEYLNGNRWNGIGYDGQGEKIYELKGGYGIIKEYNICNILIYEGEYSNGKRNGKGKEYNCNGFLIFEGEYLDGKRWNGKKFSFFDKDKIESEGEYLNGKKTGKGKEYYRNGKIEFEGEYLDGKKTGKGKEYYGNGKIEFEGEYLNGNRWNGKKFVYEENSENIKNIIKYFDGICDEYIYH